MDLDAVLAAPGFTVDEEAARGMRVILNCLNADYVEPDVSRVEKIVPDYDEKCVTIIFVSNCLMSMPKHDGKYLADLFRIADAVGIFPTMDGGVRISFTSVVWF